MDADVSKKEAPYNEVLAEFSHFRVLLIPPGGEINIIAKDFEILFESLP
jgi:hypothetical protein